MQDLFRDLGAFTVATAISLALGVQHGPAHPVPARRSERRVVHATRVVAPPHRTLLSWMDYIDFRRGSGDVLRWITPSSTADEPERTDHPRSCGTRG